LGRATATELASLVRAEHARWDDPIVCRQVFGQAEPEVIAGAIGELCEQVLGSRVAGARFYAVSVGCVAGVELEDGRAVVVKVQRATRRDGLYEASAEIRRSLAASGFPCPRPLAAPRRAGANVATFEELVDVGARGDAHEPRTRRLVAASLAELVRLARPFAAHPGLGAAWFTSLAADRVFPRPHSPLFDFEATAKGAAWIDDLAREARARRGEIEGPPVVGHFDWRVEHLRFDGRRSGSGDLSVEGERVVASYDWDSLHAEREAVLVGAVAHGFTADWSRLDIAPMPSLDEMRAFVADYEEARGACFSRAERRVVAGSLTYSLAYTARCCHARGDRQPRDDGDFRRLLAAHGREILDRF
jgi:hypothetical protein